MLNKQGLTKDKEGNVITITEARIRGSYKGAKYGALGAAHGLLRGGAKHGQLGKGFGTLG